MGSGSQDSNSTTKTTYANSSQKNPFFTSSTNKKGQTNVNFVKGTAGETAYNYVNDNIGTLLNNYLNPSLDNPVNKAKMDLYKNNLSSTSSQALQNNIINPLANNNMLRSSQATNMYNNLSNQMNNGISDYSKELIAGSQNDTWNMINNLMTMYTNAYTGMNNQQDSSIQSSVGASTKTSKSSGKAG